MSADKNIPPSSLTAESAYLFRHALLRDAAYQLQLPADRARLHGLALSVLERVLAGPTGEVPDSFAGEMSIHAGAAARDADLPPSRREVLLNKEFRYLCRAAQYARAGDNFVLAQALLARAVAHSSVSPERRQELRAEHAQMLRVVGLLADAQIICESLLSASGDINDALRARVLATLGLTYGDLGRPADSLECLDKSVHLHEANQDWDSAATCLNDLATRHQAVGNAAQALECYERALETGRRLGRPLIIRNALSGKAIYLQRSGNSREAESLVREALAIAAQSGAANIGRELTVLFMILHATGRTDEAQKCMRRAIEIHRRSGNRSSEAVALSNLANIELQHGKLDAAEAQYRASGAIHAEIGNRRSLGMVMAQLAAVASGRERVDEAISLTLEAVAHARKCRAVDVEKLAVDNLGILCLKQGRYTAAEQCYRVAFDVATRAGDTVFARCVEAQLAVLELLKGRYTVARDMALRAANEISAERHMTWRVTDVLPAQVHVHCPGWIGAGDVRNSAEDVAAGLAAAAEMRRLAEQADLLSDQPTMALLQMCEEHAAAAAQALAQGDWPLIFRGYRPSDLDQASRAAILQLLAEREPQTLAAMRDEFPELLEALRAGTTGKAAPDWRSEIKLPD